MGSGSSIFGAADPFSLIRLWMSEAEAGELNDPNAIALATVDESGLPNVRVVLLKQIERDAFVFYTNYESAKARELDRSRMAAFVMHWKSLRKQVRVRGSVSREDDAAADEYFASRDLASRQGAWASRQSAPIKDRETLLRQVDEVRSRFADEVPRPPFWGGYRIVPSEIEFWRDGAARLHDREQWVRASAGSNWTVRRLSP